MLVSALLKAKGGFVATIGTGASVNEAIAELARHNVGALVVSDDNRTVKGIISERDVVRSLEHVGATTLDQPVASIMSDEVHCCSPDDTVDSLMTTMTSHRVRHVPVVSNGALVGIVSIGDVVKNRMDELEQDRDALVNYINAR